MTGLSSAYFGEAKYQWSILLATNAHSADAGFKYMRDPYHLPAGARVCIPSLQDAEYLRAIYDRYLHSVEVSRLPVPEDISTSLVSIDPARPVKVVSWVRESQVSSFRKDASTWVTNAPNDLWVTVVPKLKEFCQDFVKKHSGPDGFLTERLEERLGLPPLNGKSQFIEFTVPDPSTTASIFRPCAVPTVSSTTCALGPPPSSVSESYKNWFFSQYYYSFGTALPSPYPWTSLGYTFDWAQLNGDRAGGFVRYGESEFVVPKGTPIQVESVASTAQYCAP